MGLELEPDSDDFVDLYRLHFGRLVSSLRLAGAPDEAAAEDIAQEAFARTFARWRKVRRGTSPAGYVYRTAFRLFAKRTGLPETPYDDVYAIAPALGHEAQLVSEIVARATLDAMPPRRRACAALCLFLGYDTDTAAEMLGIAAVTVRVQLGRARADLHRALGDELRDGVRATQLVRHRV